VYANTLYRPHDAFYQDPQWGDITDWEGELAPYYDIAESMLGVVDARADTPADDVMRRVADHFDVGGTFRPARVGVFLGEPGVEVPDPYFGGAGPSRAGCIETGGCMIGCRYNAKNSLDKNYLYLAEQAGAVVHPETEAVDVTRDNGGGYNVATRVPGSKRSAGDFAATHIVFSAGALGTTRLLLQLAARGRLPSMSPRLGHQVRTNSEVILGATARSTDVDYSRGVAITSSIHPEPRTHIEPVRYPKGSSAMGLLGTMLTDGDDSTPRWRLYLRNVLRHPVRFLRSLSVRRWAERSVVLLVMQSYDNSLRLSLEKGRFGSRLASEPETGKPAPTYIPIANEAARAAAVAMGGEPVSALNEVVLDTPTTAHVLGGAVVGDSARTGVVDPYHRMYGHPGIHVVDGSAVGANLGVNPALTITAMAERAMAMWPNRGAADSRPVLGSGYRRVDPVRPGAPTVEPAVLGADPWA
jgi:cholesterol oxidase